MISLSWSGKNRQRHKERSRSHAHKHRQPRTRAGTPKEHENDLFRGLARERCDEVDSTLLVHLQQLLLVQEVLIRTPAPKEQLHRPCPAYQVYPDQNLYLPIICTRTMNRLLNIDPTLHPRQAKEREATQAHTRAHTHEPTHTTHQ